MKTLRVVWLILFLALIVLIIQQSNAQTLADGQSQVKNLMVSPIASVQRWQCVGSGVTKPAAGTGASATASVVSASVLTLVVGSGGSSYVNPQITITGGTGTAGSITVYFTNGVITGLAAPFASGYTVGDVLTVTIVDGPLGWNCAGLQMIQLVLADGTKLGPYVNIPATPLMITNANGSWQTMPLAASDPPLTIKKFD
jgi:hypothetical protein